MVRFLRQFSDFSASFYFRSIIHLKKDFSQKIRALRAKRKLEENSRLSFGGKIFTVTIRIFAERFRPRPFERSIFNRQN
jgi:hypothetical protein